MTASAVIRRRAKSSAGTRLRQVAAGACRTDCESSRSPPARMRAGKRLAQRKLGPQWRPVVAHLARQICRIAASPDLTIDDLDPRRYRITFEADPMGNPSTGTIALSTNDTDCARASERSTTHPRFVVRKRRPIFTGTLRGRTNSTLCSAGSIRSTTRRARGLTGSRPARRSPAPSAGRPLLCPDVVSMSHPMATNPRMVVGLQDTQSGGSGASLRPCISAARQPATSEQIPNRRWRQPIERLDGGVMNFGGRPPRPPPPPLLCRRRHEVQPSVWRNRKS